MAYTRTIFGPTATAGGLTRQNIREEILEPLLGETNSDFFTDAVVNYAIGHELRLFCVETAAGPVAQFEESGDGTTRSFVLPGELIDIRRVDYDTTKDEVPFLAFEHFSSYFGDTWMANTGTGLPDAYARLGHAIIFEPIPANTTTWRVYGPIAPDAPSADTTVLLVSTGDAYVIGKRAYVWLVERNLSRLGAVPPNYERVREDARQGTKEAKERNARLHGGVRVAGRMPGRGIDDVVRRYGPFVDWNL